MKLCSYAPVEDRRAAFDWRFSVARIEVSDTAVFDAPRLARAWFEAAIGDHLDLGRPERVSLVVNRKIINRGKNTTLGRFATKVITVKQTPLPLRDAWRTYERSVDALVRQRLVT